MNITCEVCQVTFAAKDGAQAREHKGFTEYGMECPGCRKWSHAYYMTPALEEEQKRLQVRAERHKQQQTEVSWRGYQWQLSVYKRANAAVQRRIGRKLGQPVVA